ncbi:ferrochelatase [Williamsia phyllosphaerae]|uniref:Coproporphyrin III ferrochelatase n=1 Tax=Williamsia phyllosphaerae TaxID=885042 RepID=A0ABQ1V9K9_9NOCA|nr:ferrochelatase [Williamsia phyllosphaerae]GGF42104.1 ferrochelatase [Williamsia phyllosphaerae]
MSTSFDSILVLSFGGPDGPDDVRPFLENVTRGRGVPPERLDEVAEHYLHFGGVSPINRLNLDIIDHLRAGLDAAGIDLPVYFGNRNWHPMIEDTVSAMYDDERRHALVFPTSAWGGYSGCAQYHEDIRRALDALSDKHGQPGTDLMDLRKLPHYWDRPEMTAACADAITAARDRLPADRRGDARLVFTAHSIPSAADKAAGPPAQGGHLYSRQVAAASERAAAAAGFAAHDLVWQSRSGPPQIPWLEPDICDHLETLAAQNLDPVIVCPIGFVSDHLEVVWDLDTEAVEVAERLDLPMERAGTVGVDPRFTDMIVSLISAQLQGLDTDAAGMGCTENGARCAVGCCVSQRPSRPAA